MHSPKKKTISEKQDQANADKALASPTSISMKNSFIIKNADASFDSYYAQMKKRKAHNTNVGEATYGRIAGRRPAARDGHSSLIFKDFLVIFGGDRHHMPFNDIYYLDLAKELQK